MAKPKLDNSDKKLYQFLGLEAAEKRFAKIYSELVLISQLNFKSMYQGDTQVDNKRLFKVHIKNIEHVLAEIKRSL